ncbi:hypothetical protein [Streptomyces mangrovisoli]|uniref:Secreted protein n=1 Tax=Streptomyces mangrovisoli TaxID=1428628 RepID=A0A1J4P6I7_9ACTN|nr:hypothetical protein [Streptomyces mangrovisoli]OIJ69372.1 hypothetical protein WN71_002370 [Streptomyces mangrovisoli]
MKPTVRRTIAAVVTGVAAAAAAVGAAAAPAAAVGSVPIPVPLDGAEKSLGVELPEVGGELPLPLPGAPEGPRYTEGRLLPDRALPQLPLTGGLPGLDARAPLPHVLGPGFDHAGVSAPAADLSALTPGLAVDAPLTQPNPDHFGLPDLRLPQAGVLAPVLRTVPGADLVAGPGR